MLCIWCDDNEATLICGLCGMELCDDDNTSTEDDPLCPSCEKNTFCESLMTESGEDDDAEG